MKYTFPNLDKNKGLCFVTMQRSGVHWFRHIAELVLYRGTTKSGSKESIARSYYPSIHKHARYYL